MTKIVEKIKKKNILTGITPSGIPHIGNYFGAIKPALQLADNPNFKSYFFIADYHSLIKLQDVKLRNRYIYEVAASWLALGLNPEKVVFYRQSSIPEIMEANWILNSVTVKGWLNRAHAYKAIIDVDKSEDLSINMGLFNYPILMAADIILFNTDLVPVGKDQIQHIEITRNIVNRFNHVYGCKILKVPKAVVDAEAQIIPGIDGKKMSKSYNNTIHLFSPSCQLKKQIMKIVTNSQLPKDPKDPKTCTIFNLYKHFADKSELNSLAKHYAAGISWGDAKQILFDKMNGMLQPLRERYEYYISNKSLINQYLADGAEKARVDARRLLMTLKKNIGI